MLGAGRAERLRHIFALVLFAYVDTGTPLQGQLRSGRIDGLFVSKFNQYPSISSRPSSYMHARWLGLSRCRGGQASQQQIERSSQPLPAPTAISANSTASVNTSFEDFVWSKEFAEKGHDPLFMQGLTKEEADKATKEYIKQVRVSRHA